MWTLYNPLIIFISLTCVKNVKSLSGTCPQLNPSLTSISENVKKDNIFHAQVQGFDDVALNVDPNIFLSNFSISFNKSTGQVSVSINPLLDSDVLPTEDTKIFLKLSCKKGSGVQVLSNPSQLILSDENDKPPVFLENPIIVNISEALLPGSEIITLEGKAVDPDLKKLLIVYHINDLTNHFGIKTDTSKGRVVLQHPLDYDNGRRVFTVRVNAYDGRWHSHADLIINVSDEDDQNPVFTKPFYKISVPEDTPVQSSFPTHIHAYDTDFGINQTVEYSIEGNHPEFDISTNGSIYLKRKLDRETTPEYFLTIKGYQTDEPKSRYSTAILHVNVGDANDNPPVMSVAYYHSSIAENTPSGTIVLTVSAHDIDKGVNSEFAFHLHGIDSSPFKISTSGNNGIIEVNNSNLLDFDSNKKSFHFMVSAQETKTTDRRRSRRSNVSIQLSDVNDNPPIFTKPNGYTFTVRKTKTFIGLVHATDKDKGNYGHVVYKLESSSSLFHIDEHSGVLTKLSQHKSFNRKYNLFVRGEDSDPNQHNRRFSIVPVEVNVEDENINPPKFSSASYVVKVSESELPGTVLKQVQATDEDPVDTLAFSITNGNLNRTFSLNATSGIFLLVQPLDRETHDEYNLTIKVTDGLHSAITVIQVIVEDVNDNSPSFLQSLYNFSVPENTAENVGIVKAVDADAGKNGDLLVYQIFPGAWSDHFAVGSNGEVELVKVLDREKVEQISLVIAAHDNGNPRLTGTTKLIVHVMDVNDNPPTFPDSNKTCFVDEGVTGLIKCSVEAFDNDIDQKNKETGYKIINKGSPFSVNHMGEIHLNRQLHLDKTGSNGDYHLMIEAFNKVPYNPTGSNGRMNLLIHIKDINDHYPVFNNTCFKDTLYVAEDTSVGKVLERICANDDDASSEYSTITYWILSGNNESLFRIDAKSGDLSLAKPLDYDAPGMDREIHLIIAASDMKLGVNRRINNITTSVIIHVTDVNDNPPQFSQNLYECFVSELDNGFTSCKVSATDKDTGYNGLISYSVLKEEVVKSGISSRSSSSAVLFGINDKNGTIDVKHNLMNFVGKTIRLEVKASDHGLARQEEKTIVLIHIQDVNNHAPTFHPSTVNFTVVELSAGELFSVKADDEDIDPINKETLYRLIGRDHNLFHVLKNGSVAARKPLQLTGTNTDVYNIIIEAYNKKNYSNGHIKNGRQNARIIVKDVNDHKPTFKTNMFNTTVTVMENHPEDKPILRVIAKDDDHSKEFNTVSYWIHTSSATSMFRIDQQTGDVFSLKALDYDNPVMDKDVNITVYASDLKPAFGNGEMLNISIVVQIHISDVNDNKPVFNQSTYTCTIFENKLGRTDCSVFATDIDRGLNQKVSYILKNGFAKFTIDRLTGVLSVTRKIDYESDHRKYSLLVKAVDHGTIQQTSSVVVDVLVENINDELPVFNNKSYIYQITENSPKKSLLGQVVAMDADSPKLKYYFPSSCHGLSILEDGHLETTEVFDYEKRKQISCLVSVTDGDFNNTAHITLNIVDVNDNHPNFIPDKYIFYIPEDVNLPHCLHKFNVVDADDGIFKRVTLNILNGNTNGVFKLDGSKLCLNRSLDYNIESSFKLLITGHDGGSPSLVGSATVIIHVNDTNNKAPQFEKKEYSFSIDENRETGTQLGLIIARDPDTKSNLHYSIMDSSFPFQIDHQNGTLSTTLALDFELQSLYVFSVSVFDGIHTTLTKVKVSVNDLNDNHPQFEHTNYNIFIGENTKVNKKVTTVSASDKDVSNTGFTYRIPGSDHMFSIHKDSGEIYVSGDPLIVGKHELIIFVEDKGTPTLSNVTSVTIFINKTDATPPFFSKPSYEVTIKENQTLMVPFVTVKAEDPDSGQAGMILYNITSENNKDTFIIDEKTGQISINKSLNYEETRAYQLTVEAIDMAIDPQSTTTLVMITVENINEPPKLVLDPIALVTPIKPSTVIGSVYAVDPDISQPSNVQDITYKLLNDSRFSLNPSTGVLVSGKKQVDFTSDIVLAIKAVDSGGLTDEGTLLIRLAKFAFDPALTFVKLNENEPTGTLLLDVNTTEKDNVIYSLKNDLGYFAISNLGIIKTMKPIDRELHSEFRLTVKAVSSKYSSIEGKLRVEIDDVNDNAPYFPFSYARKDVEETLPVGSYVLSLCALDEDAGSQLVFSVVDDTNAYFNVTRDGNVTVAKSLHIKDPDHDAVIVFKVEVTDGLYNATTNVSIHVINMDDDKPYFPYNQYNTTIKENTPLNTTLFTIKAKDRDPKDGDSLLYSFSQGPDSQKYFGINEKTSAVFIKSTIDREKVGEFLFFTVSANDSSGNVGFMKVKITVEDANEFSPTCKNRTLHIQEGGGSTNKTFVLTGYDMDATFNLKFILLDDYNSIFNLLKINRTEVQLRATRELDREHQDKYLLRLQVQDHPTVWKSGICLIHIIVDDINDNVPQFSLPIYETRIREDSTNGSIVIKKIIVATDPDSGIKGKDGLIYSLTGDGSDLFHINTKSGDVYTNGILDRETRDLFNLTVTATDLDGRGLSSTAGLVIIIEDVDDNAPVFNARNYTFHIPEAANISSIVGSVSASDVDKTDSIFYLLKGSIKFSINQKNGTIQTEDKLDREKQDSYHLQASASDSVHITTIPVHIILDDVNDNCPIFTKTIYTFNAMENQSPGQRIGTLKASDQDGGENGKVYFSLNNTGSSDAGLFNVTETGHVFALGDFDREKKSVYHLNVVASDNGTPPCSTSAEMYVLIDDQNDNSPIFCHGIECNVTHLEISMMENTPAKSPVMLFTVMDNDWEKSHDMDVKIVGKGSKYFELTSSFIQKKESVILKVKDKFDIEMLMKEGILPNVSDTFQFSLNVNATDRGIPNRSSILRLHITITQADADHLYFSDTSYSFSVDENNNEGQQIGMVQALQNNSTVPGIKYSIVDKEHHPEFVIGEETGELTANMTLDYEQEKEHVYVFFIQATKGRVAMKKALAAVTVHISDTNDNIPQFSKSFYAVSVIENSVKQNLIQVTATDADSNRNGDVYYEIIQNPLNDTITIGKETGWISLNVALDREKQENYTFVIQATDKGDPPKNSSVQLFLYVDDVNDNSPVFYGEPYEFVIDENASPTTLGRVYANDSDVDTVFYQFSDTSQYVFHMDLKDGTISNLIPLDFEQVNLYDLSVLAIDNGEPPRSSSTSIRIHVRNTLPQFSQKYYEVNITTDFTVGMKVINLSNGFENISYSITAGNEKQYFGILDTTGQIIIQKLLKSSGQYLLTVTMTDGTSNRSTDVTQVKINVYDTNIKFTQSGPITVKVEENHVYPYLLLDLDSTYDKKNKTVKFSIKKITPDTKLFILNSSTGELFLIGQLDREAVSVYELQIQLSETQGHVQRRSAVSLPKITVIVSVQDVNDNPPKFITSNSSLIFGIPYNARVNHHVGRVQAFDADSGFNGLISYRTVDGDKDTFTVDSTSGIIKSVRKIENISKNRFSLVIEARDRNGTGLSSNVTVTIVAVADGEKLVIVADIPLSVFKKHQSDIVRKLSIILGCQVLIDKLEQHVENTVSSIKYNVEVTDMYFHALDHNKGSVITKEEIQRRLKDKNKEINDLFKALYSKEVTSVPVKTSNKFTVAAIALICLAVILLCGSIIAIVLVRVSWNRLKKERKKESLDWTIGINETRLHRDNEGFEGETSSSTNEIVIRSTYNQSGSEDLSAVVLTEHHGDSEAVTVQVSGLDDAQSTDSTHLARESPPPSNEIPHPSAETETEADVNASFEMTQNESTENVPKGFSMQDNDITDVISNSSAPMNTDTTPDNHLDTGIKESNGHVVDVEEDSEIMDESTQF